MRGEEIRRRICENIPLWITIFSMILCGYFSFGGTNEIAYWILLTVIGLLCVGPYIVKIIFWHKKPKVDI